MSLIIEHLNRVDKQTWEALIADSDDVWLYHRHDWIEGVSRIYGVESHYFIASQNNRWLGAFPIQLRRLSGKRHARGRLSSVLLGAAGPLVISGVSLEERDTILSALNEAVLAFARISRIEKINAGLPPLASNRLQTDVHKNPLVALGWEDRSSDTLIASLQRTEAELWSDLAYDARRSVKLSRAAGYTVERVRWADMLEDYYRIHSETYERTGVKPHPKAYFELIAEMEGQGNAVLWVGRDPQGRPVAFHNCGRFKEASIYWTGCCETAHLRSNINYLLFWEAMLGAQRDGCRWYEIGEVFPNPQSDKQRGLTTFKKKFGGDRVRFYRAEWSLKVNQAGRWMLFSGLKEQIFKLISAL